MERDGYTIHKMVFQTEPGIWVPALDFAPAEWNGQKWVLYVHGLGMAADAGVGGPIEKLVTSG